MVIPGPEPDNPPADLPEPEPEEEPTECCCSPALHRALEAFVRITREYPISAKQRKALERIEAAR